MQLYQPTITGSLSVSGSINLSGSITIAGGGTISGTASIATNAITASSADNFLVRNTLTAQTLVVQTITSSVDFVTGSTRFGSVIGNTHVFTGSMFVTGAAVFSEQLTATSPSTLFKEGFIVKATTTGGGGSQPAYTYYTAAGSKRWSSFLNVGDDKLHIANALNSEVFTIIQSGSVGIGTTTPGTRLDVRGVARIGGSSEAVTIGSYTDTYSGYYSVINSTNNGDLSFNSNLYNNGVDLVTVNTHGSMTGASIVLWGNNATLGANTIAFYSRTPGSTTAGTIVSGSNASMVIKGGGNVGIGVTNPNNKLDVSGNTVLNGTVSFGTAAAAANSFTFYQNYSVGQPGTDWYSSTGAVIFGFNGNTKALFLGNLTGGATTLSTDASGNIIRTPSDINLKTNIEDLQYGLETIMQLRPIIHNWKQSIDMEEEKSINMGEEKSIGFIAQEVELLVPEIVCGDDYKSIDYPKLTAVLVKALQELNTKFEEYKATHP